MGIGTRRASTSAATTLLLLFTAMGTAAAIDDGPSGGPSASESLTTDINDRQDWDEETEVPLDDRDERRCDYPSTWIKITSKKAYHVPSWWNGTKYKDGPGGTMTVEVIKSA